MFESVHHSERARSYLALYVLAARIFCIWSLLVKSTCRATNQRTCNFQSQLFGWNLLTNLIVVRDSREGSPAGEECDLLPSWQGGLVRLPSYDQNSLNLATLARASGRDSVISISWVSLNRTRGEGNCSTKASLVFPGSSIMANTAFSWPSASTCTRCSSARVR